MYSNHDKKQPDTVCLQCADKYGDLEQWQPTWTLGTCGVCYQQAAVTTPDQVGYLELAWRGARAA